jgi:hypothetical protein
MQPSLGPLLQLLRLISADPDVPLQERVKTAWMHHAPSEVDVEDDFEVGPPQLVQRCEARLEMAGVEFAQSRLPVRKKGSSPGGHLCGAYQVVRYAEGPGGIRWRGRPKVTCPVALALARFETLVQEEAMRTLGRKVVRIEHMGTYNCREMAAYPGWVSEHSYANAIDIKSFILRGGRTITVLDDYGDPAEAPDDPAADFLRSVARRAYEEDVFSVVLTPAFDRAHRNHFHLDMARYRVSGL